MKKKLFFSTLLILVVIQSSLLMSMHYTEANIYIYNAKNNTTSLIINSDCEVTIDNAGKRIDSDNNVTLDSKKAINIIMNNCFLNSISSGSLIYTAGKPAIISDSPRISYFNYPTLYISDEGIKELQIIPEDVSNALKNASTKRIAKSAAKSILSAPDL